jgi:quinol monooxygenase YgiN
MGQSSQVYFIVSLAIHDNGMAEFEAIAREMIETTRQERGCVGYDWYLDTDRKQCRLLELYVDAGAVLTHLRGRVVQEHVAKLLQCSAITTFEVYGDPGEEAATVLQGVGAKIFSPWKMLHG